MSYATNLIRSLQRKKVWAFFSQAKEGIDRAAGVYALSASSSSLACRRHPFCQERNKRREKTLLNPFITFSSCLRLRNLSDRQVSNSSLTGFIVTDRLFCKRVYSFRDPQDHHHLILSFEKTSRETISP